MVQLDRFSKWPPLLWFWPPRMGLKDPRIPSYLPIWHPPSLLSAHMWKHLKERNASESLQWVSTLMLTLQLPELEPVWLVILDPLFPNPNSCRMASGPEPVQIPPSGLHLIFYHESVVNTELAFPFRSLLSHPKRADGFLKMAWSYST